MVDGEDKKRSSGDRCQREKHQRETTRTQLLSQWNFKLRTVTVQVLAAPAPPPPRRRRRRRRDFEAGGAALLFFFDRFDAHFLAPALQCR